MTESIRELIEKTFRCDMCDETVVIVERKQAFIPAPEGWTRGPGEYRHLCVECTTAWRALVAARRPTES